MVLARSEAEIPVVTPLSASIDTVKFVSLEVSLPLCLSNDSPKVLHLDSVRVRQIRPLHSEAIKLISEGLTN